MNRLWRVRHRSPAWAPQTAHHVRIFAREGDARRFASRRRRKGDLVELAVATVSPWQVQGRPLPTDAERAAT